MKPVAAKAAKPRQAVATSSARKPTKAAAKQLPAHYAVPKSDGDGAVQAWIDLLPDWQSRARRVDAAVSTQVCEYVPDIPAALAELYRVLRPGGRAAILDTDYSSL